MKTAKLRRAIQLYIRDLNTLEGKAAGHPVLNDEQLDFLASNLTEFVESASKKYLVGQLEHGGDIKDRPLLKESKKEVIDLWHYLSGAEVKARNI